MYSFAIFILLIASLNIWLALTILHSVITGATRIRKRTYQRQKEPAPFWIAVGCKAAAALLSYSYLVNIISLVVRHKP